MPRSCCSLKASPLACCAHAPCGSSASAIMQAPSRTATPLIEPPPEHRRLFWRAYDRAGRKGSALYVDADLRLPPGLTPRPRLRQPMPAPAITPNRPPVPVMTIRIGTSERDGTFYSQGRALKTLFERRPAL